MNWSWKLGRVAGIDLFLHPTFLIVLLWAWALGGGLGAVVLTAAVFGCVLLHELGHALAAREFGIATEDITLYPIGGVARLRRMPQSPVAEMVISLAGPAVNVAIAAALWVALGLTGMSGAWPVAFVANLMWVNVGLAAFNMLPVFPMDGGRVLRAVLSGPLGRARATEIAAGLGRALAVVFGVFCVLNGLFVQALLAAFVYFAAGAELEQVIVDEQRRRTPRPTTDGIWLAPPGYRWVSRGQGIWQLVPIVVSDWERARPWR